MLCRLATGTYAIPVPYGGGVGHYGTRSKYFSECIYFQCNRHRSAGTGTVKDIKKSYRYLYRYDFDLVAKIPVPKSGKYL